MILLLHVHYHLLLVFLLLIHLLLCLSMMILAIVILLPASEHYLPLLGMLLETPHGQHLRRQIVRLELLVVSSD